MPSAPGRMGHNQLAETSERRKPKHEGKSDRRKVFHTIQKCKSIGRVSSLVQRRFICPSLLSSSIHTADHVWRNVPRDVAIRYGVRTRALYEHIAFN